jgi:hypothetical protein
MTKSLHLIKLKMVCNETMLSDLWWNTIPGTKVRVNWPKADGYDSIDPNDRWRPWLEQHVGRQGWDWNWRLNLEHNAVDVKFRWAHADKLSMFLLKYA